jgi:hypothetical protein
MDVLESFGTPNVSPLGTAFHVDSVGGSDSINYSSWPQGLDSAGVPSGAERDPSAYHTYTWLYKTDDSYIVYYDGYVVQKGSITGRSVAGPEPRSSTCGSSSTSGGAIRKSRT